MKITDVLNESTTSGSIATVATPLSTQSRKGGNLLTGKKTKKKYANSLSEGKMKELSMDLTSGPDGLSDEEFKKKYGKTKQEMRKALKQKPEQQKKVDEAKLEEDDLIIVPGQGHKLKPGFIPRDKDRRDHEVEMSRSDLLATMKNAKAIYHMIADVSEDQGLEGWVQEKIIKASDYLNSVAEYLDNKKFKQENVSMGGVIAGGQAYEGVEESDISGLLGAAKLVKDFIITAEVDGITKKFRVRGMTGPNAAKERFLKHASNAKIIDVKQVTEGVAEGQISEKAVSKAQQRFMGMAHAIQKGEKIPGASKELKATAKGMSKKAAHDYAATKHKGLPEKVDEGIESDEVEVYTQRLAAIDADTKKKVQAAYSKYGKTIPQPVYMSIERARGDAYRQLVKDMPEAHKEYVNLQNKQMWSDLKGWDRDELSGRSGVE